ncbi:MAG: hypothetical protein ABSE69_09070, partial [Roseiarcus sp.]
IPYYSKLETLHAFARELPRRPGLADFAHVIDEVLKRALAASTSSRELLAQAQNAIEGVLK